MFDLLEGAAYFIIYGPLVVFLIIMFTACLMLNISFPRSRVRDHLRGWMQELEDRTQSVVYAFATRSVGTRIILESSHPPGLTCEFMKSGHNAVTSDEPPASRILSAGAIKLITVGFSTA